MPLPNQDATQIVTNNGLRTQYGVIIPPGAKVAAFVRSTGAGDDGADSFLIQNLVTTLAAGLARCRPGKGDFVIVLPGHAENVVDGTTFSAAMPSGGGVNILGVGAGALAPTFSFTVTTGNWTISQPNVVIAGLRLVPAITGVVTMVTINSTDVGLYNNTVFTSQTSINVVTPVVISANGVRADVSGNSFRSAAGVVTTSGVINVNGTPDGVRICDNEMNCAGVTTALVNFAAAATNLRVLRNTLTNSVAASVAAINFANAASTGQCAYNNIGVLVGGTVTDGTTGIGYGASVLVSFNQNFVTPAAGKSGRLTPVATA